MDCCASEELEGAFVSPSEEEELSAICAGELVSEPLGAAGCG
jgi:hypothetical protein